jgi:hypothetical protein
VVIRARNASGVSAISQPVSFQMYGVPSAPKAITVVTLSEEVYLYVSGVQPFGSPIDNFQYSYTTDNINYTMLTVPAAPIALPNLVYDQVYLIDISGLTNDVSYTNISVRAHNSFGWGPSALAPVVYPRGVPDAPTGLVATAYDQKIGVSFTDGSNNGAPITGYLYSLDAGQTWFTAVHAVSPISCFAVTNNVSYRVMIKAVNVMGASPASVASNAVIPFGIPFAPVITRLIEGNASMKVFFAPVNTNGRAITSMQYSLGAGSYSTLAVRQSRGVLVWARAAHTGLSMFVR